MMYCSPAPIWDVLSAKRSEHSWFVNWGLENFGNQFVFSCQELSISMSIHKGQLEEGTHIFPDDGTQRRDPQDAISRDPVLKETFTGEHGFADAL